MKLRTYRIIYWLGSITTDWIVNAISAEDAIEEFIEVKGDKEIVSIEEVTV